MIKEMWYTRRNMLKYEKENKKKVRNNDENINITRSDPGPRRNVRERVRIYQSPGRNVGIIFGENRGTLESRGF